MNRTLTESRIRLTIENASDLMFISINGPPVEDFSPKPYVNVWLRDRRSTLSAPRGKERQETDEENLFK